jgi:hypothetical protein
MDQRRDREKKGIDKMKKVEGREGDR